MIQTIADLITATVLSLVAFLLTPAAQRFLTSNTTSQRIDSAKHLTTLVIAGVITDLYNGVDTGELSLDAQIVHIQCRLTDVLMINGFSPADFNPQPLVAAVLTESKLRRPLIEAIRDRQERVKCPESTSSTSTTPQ